MGLFLVGVSAAELNDPYPGVGVPGTEAVDLLPEGRIARLSIFGVSAHRLGQAAYLGVIEGAVAFFDASQQSLALSSFSRSTRTPVSRTPSRALRRSGRKSWPRLGQGAGARAVHLSRPARLLHDRAGGQRLEPRNPSPIRPLPGECTTAVAWSRSRSATHATIA